MGKPACTSIPFFVFHFCFLASYQQWEFRQCACKGLVAKYSHRMGGTAIADVTDVAVVADDAVTAPEEVLGEVSKAEAAAMEQI